MKHLIPPSIIWKLRRFLLPINNNALVLEVGSGGNPYFRSNILLDKYIETSQRHFKPLTVDRPCFICDALCLPFRNKVFDFVIAAHVLEHVENPVQFLSELQRVAKAGYIEVPNVVFERLNPYHDHLNELSISQDGTLLIRKKIIPKPDPFLVDEYERTSHRSVLRLIKQNPFNFHITLFWHNEIKFSLCQPCTIEDYGEAETFNNFGDHVTIASSNEKAIATFFSIIRSCFHSNLANLFRKYYILQNLRSIKLPFLLSLLQCPSCNSKSFDIVDNNCICNDCNFKFPLLGLK